MNTPCGLSQFDPGSGAELQVDPTRRRRVAVASRRERSSPPLEYVRHAEGQSPMFVAEVFDVEGGRIVASRVYQA